MTFDDFFRPNAATFLAQAQREMPGASLLEQQWQANRIAWTTFKNYYAADAAAAEATGNVPAGVSPYAPMPPAGPGAAYTQGDPPGPAYTQGGGAYEQASGGTGAGTSPTTLLLLVGLAAGGYWYFNRK